MLTAHSLAGTDRWTVDRACYQAHRKKSLSLHVSSDVSVRLLWEILKLTRNPISAITLTCSLLRET